ncbi:PDZ domain-containing protein, partial [Butyricicoccus sp. 1XD8-22]
QQYVNIPSNITLLEGQEQIIPKGAAVSTMADSPENFTYSEQAKSVSLTAEAPGKDELFLQIAGLPVKKVDVNVLKNFKVFPGGQSIGVRLNTLGVLVVGHHLVSTKSEKGSPGEDAGIQVGDIITKINGKEIKKMEQVAPFVEDAGKSGKALDLTVQREKEKFQTKLLPLKDEKEQ